MNSTDLLKTVRAALGDQAKSVTLTLDEVTVEVTPEQYHSVCERLRDHSELGFDCFIDLCGVDYLGFGQGEWETDAVSSNGFSRGVGSTAENFLGSPGRFRWDERPDGNSEPRFAVVVHLLSVALNHRIRVRGLCADNDLPIIPSIVDVWAGAHWFEREAFDLFGIVFEGHPDLRRLLTDYGFVGHPFRKDFPLIGNVEVRYDAIKGRVVYEPVSIDPRVGVPRVVREDARYEQARAEAASRKS